MDAEIWGIPVRDLESWMWAEALEMVGRAERLQRQFFQPAGQARGMAWEPPVDVYETELRLWVVVALPGVAPEKVVVGFDGHTLVVAGERHLPMEEQGVRIHRLEIPHGRFERRVDLPPRLELERRELANGCLYLGFRKH